MSTLTDIVAEGHRQSEHKLCRSIEAIIAKYSHEFPDSDVVDLEAMVICEDRGELKSGNAHLFGTMHAAPTVDTRGSLAHIRACSYTLVAFRPKHLSIPCFDVLVDVVLDCLMDAVAGSDSDESCVEEEDDGKPEPQRAKKRAKRLRPPGQVFEDVQCTETVCAQLFAQAAFYIFVCIRGFSSLNRFCSRM
ncbi:uncharacterized protein MONBRDRAFT_9717 [Monosiga brevicollis MX1]|uniref:Uncharacterized protein n=1 Tax=Monosiga brevicollis TaxID=81824 RepID=A9V3K2_MONBE|nr:uncharacterized protein MONBRDRAFT_9717 [Monosiga brevicollis MX1]EDQ87927.1 predicted protein [Monosiga brevicollis MX1]|eukprot:XP_001747460.1 hypothetical protein [Monosiga brevicollis MX1]